MRIHGTVIVGGSSHLVDWTIDETGTITSAGGLSSAGLSWTGSLFIPVEVEAEAVVTDNYESLTVVDLRVLLTERGEPIYGNKSDLITRLRAWEASNPDGVGVVVEEAVEDSGESDEIAVDGESEGDTIE